MRWQQLQPYNIVIAEQVEYLLAEVLDSLSYNQRPKLKQGARGRQQLVGALQDCPRGSQYRSKMAQEAPPNRPKTAQEAPKRRPQTAQEAPKTAQEPPKTAPGGPRQGLRIV